MNDPFENAHIERYCRSRRYAEIAIQTALLVCEARNSTNAQIADLADAVDALAAGQFSVATALAEAAIEGRRKELGAQRPASMTKSLAEVRTMMAGLVASGTSVGAG